MKITSVTPKTFRHTTQTVRDSDGHGHPDPVSDTTSTLLTTTTDTGPEGHIIVGTAQVSSALLDRFVRPNLIGEDPLNTERLCTRSTNGSACRGGLLIDRLLCAVDLALWDLKGKAAGPAAAEWLPLEVPRQWVDHVR